MKSKRSSTSFTKTRQPKNKKPRGKSAVTKLKEAIGIDKTISTIEQIEKNIDEFVKHPDTKIRLDATKAFCDYYKPKKKDINIEGSVGVNMNINLTGIDEAKLKKTFVDE